ncbi:MAG TPA: hypothetical protein VI585_23080, partial [Candidatus Binatia bacterium]
HASKPGQDKRGNRKLAAVELPGNDHAVARADVIETFGKARLEVKLNARRPDRSVKQSLGVRRRA